MKLSIAICEQAVDYDSKPVVRHLCYPPPSAIHHAANLIKTRIFPHRSHLFIHINNVVCNKFDYELVY